MQRAVEPRTGMVIYRKIVTGSLWYLVDGRGTRHRARRIENMCVLDVYVVSFFERLCTNGTPS